MLDGRSAWRGGVGWGGDDGARWGARRWPGSAWWPGLADSPLTTVDPVEARLSRGVNPTHTEPQPDTAGEKLHKGGNSTRGNPPANNIYIYMCVCVYIYLSIYLYLSIYILYIDVMAAPLSCVNFTPTRSQGLQL